MAKVELNSLTILKTTQMIYGIILIILGVLAAPSILLSRRPDAQEILDKITPYQGWIGLVYFFWGIWITIRAILGIGLLKSFPIWWATWLASGVMEATLGFLLGYTLINQYVLSNSEGAAEKGQEMIQKLRPMQTKLGFIGIVLGIWVIVAYFLRF